MTTTYNKLKKLAESNGWRLLRTKGGHSHYGKEGAIKIVTIPEHGNKDVPKGLENKILKDLGLK